MQKIGIMGLGLNGLISAITMKIAGYEVVVFEPSDLSKITNDNRTSALTFETISFFKELDIYENLKGFLAPIEHIYTFEISESPILSFDAEDVSKNPFGFVVSNSKLKEVLFEKMKALGVPIVKEKVMEFKNTGSFINAFLSTGEELTFKLILNCSGKTFTEKTHVFDYNQTGFTFEIAHEKDHKNIAIESFSAEGPIAILPFTKKTSSAVIWTVKTETAEYLKSLSQSDFLNEFRRVTKRMAHIGDIFEITSEVKSYPLSLSFQSSQVKERMIILGDAFNSIHPVAGQAFNMSLKDIINLYLDSKNALRLGLDVGSETFLKSLARKNLKHHIEMNIFTHFIVRIFSNNSKMLKVLRNCGVRILENVSPLKKFLMNKASGF